MPKFLFVGCAFLIGIALFSTCGGIGIAFGGSAFGIPAAFVALVGAVAFALIGARVYDSIRGSRGGSGTDQWDDPE